MAYSLAARSRIAARPFGLPDNLLRKSGSLLLKRCYFHTA